MHRSPLLDLHATAGAVLADPAGPAPLLLTYGDVPGEYEAARGAAVLLDETTRGLVRVHGADARELLHRLLANEVLPLEPGRGNRNLLLTPKGKVRFDFQLTVAPDGAYLLDAEPGDGARLREALDMYVFNEAVELEDRSAEAAPLLLVGPAAADAARAATGLEPPDEVGACAFGEFAGHPLRVTRLRALGVDALRLDAGAAGALELWRALAAHARPAGRVAADILRVAAVAALPGEDVNDEIYPQEARLEEAFSLAKGCYIGQEVVAKIDTYGGLNKRLCALRVSHDDPVSAGTRLFRQDPESGEWRDLGVVTSWAYSFEDDTGRVLAYLKRRHQAPGTVFRLGEGPATAEVVVGTDDEA